MLFHSIKDFFYQLINVEELFYNGCNTITIIICYYKDFIFFYHEFIFRYCLLIFRPVLAIMGLKVSAKKYLRIVNF